MNFKKRFEFGENDNNGNGRKKTKKNEKEIIEQDESTDITTHELANRQVEILEKDENEIEKEKKED